VSPTCSYASYLLVTREPIPVDPSRDLLDWVGAFSGLVGALLAAYAIFYASRQSAEAKRDLIRERRAEFELGLLAEIRRQMSITQFQHLAGYVGALIPNSVDETDLPALRAAIGVKAGPNGQRYVDEVRAEARGARQDAQHQLLITAQIEVDDAIQRRLRGKT
jgi:hypothetical protein